MDTSRNYALLSKTRKGARDESPSRSNMPPAKGEVTAILGINQDKATGSDYYDLQGHKSSTNAKGIRIQNGKKTIIK